MLENNIQNSKQLNIWLNLEQKHFRHILAANGSAVYSMILRFLQSLLTDTKHLLMVFLHLFDSDLAFSHN